MAVSRTKTPVSGSGLRGEFDLAVLDFFRDATFDLSPREALSAQLEPSIYHRDEVLLVAADVKLSIVP